VGVSQYAPHSPEGVLPPSLLPSLPPSLPPFLPSSLPLSLRKTCIIFGCVALSHARQRFSPPTHPRTHAHKRTQTHTNAHTGGGGASASAAVLGQRWGQFPQPSPNPKPYTPNPKPYILNSKPYNLKPETLFWANVACVPLPLFLSSSRPLVLSVPLPRKA